MLYTNSRLARLLVLLLALFGISYEALAGVQPVGDVIVVPSGGERAVTSGDFRPHKPVGSAYNEIWSYTFMLNDGMQATFSMSHAYLGSLMAPISGAEFSISGFNGKTYRAPKEYDAEDLMFTSATSKLQVHPSIYVEGALPQRHSIHFGAGKNGVSYEVALTLSDIATGLTWGDGVFKLGKEKLGMFIHIPFARVAGTVTIDGVAKRVSGTAYMDHTFQTDFATKLVRSSYRYVQHTGEAEVGHFVAPHARYDDRVVGLGAVKEGGRFRLRKPQELQTVSTRRTLGVEVPNQLAVHYEGGGHTILNRERDQQSFSVLEELSGLQKAVVKRFIGGEVLVFRGRGTTNQRGRIVYDYLVVK